MPKNCVLLLKASRSDLLHTMKPQFPVQRYFIKTNFSVGGWNTPYSAHLDPPAVVNKVTERGTTFLLFAGEYPKTLVELLILWCFFRLL